MLYSKPCEYAIRALAHIAQAPKNEEVRAAEIAKKERLPGPVLAKVLQELVRKGLLKSRRGPGGGFRLARRAESIALRDVVGAIDGLDHFSECAVGLERCSDETPCPLHDTFKAIRAQVQAYLEETNIAEMAAAIERKRRLQRGR
jgi:Rrf2 family protein